MNIIFCKPELTMTELKAATAFFQECAELLNLYVANVQYISTGVQMNQLLAQEASKNDILVCFTSEKGKYDDTLLKLIMKVIRGLSR